MYIATVSGMRPASNLHIFQGGQGAPRGWQRASYALTNKRPAVQTWLGGNIVFAETLEEESVATHS
jgi:hypothetical protein